ncbi:MAG: ABC transporter permease [Pseudomonadales bacterium]|jgi:putative ABC transport system permease protein|nr:ABC transporter permease [Pseudomonadales bacterium]MCP5319379.1 ABC transporter permease [Pseudomonadales bacterium]MCP5336918.1 ABC transporter permease [Pseudomonadales bacterium]
MRTLDLVGFTLLVLRRQRFRSFMLLLSVGIGVAAVLVLIALGEGARGYVMREFEFIGKDIVVMFPGRKSTTGGLPPVTGVTTREITLSDLTVVARTVHGFDAIAPLVIGNAEVSFGNRAREAVIIGSNADFFPMRHLAIARGHALPVLDLTLGSPVAVIGSTIERELFGSRSAIGEWVRMRGYRFRVIGVLEGRGDSFGMDLSESIFIPVASAQTLFDTQALFRVMLRVRPGADVENVKRDLLVRMSALHDGNEDVTVVSPDAMISTFDGILRMLTLAIAGIAAVSLVVAGILVMNLMLISVRQRTAEIGLLKALGAPAAQVRTLFLAEAGLLAAAGVLLGSTVGYAATALLCLVYPEIPFHVPVWATLAAAAFALSSALLFAWLPARRAAALEPVLALGGR